MLNTLCPLVALAFEAEHVVEMRLIRLAWGGPAAWVEAQVMVAEKAVAAVEATLMLMTGGSPVRVIARYREHVAANEARLTAG